MTNLRIHRVEWEVLDMPIHRVSKDRDFTRISNYMFRDKALSSTAIGVLCRILSLPDDWNFSVRGLIAICKESDTAIRSALKELSDAGYYEVTKERREHGRFEFVYNIYEVPKDVFPDMVSPHMDSPYMENPHMENPHMESPNVELPHMEIVPQLTTNISTTKELTTKKSTTRKRKRSLMDMVAEYTEHDGIRESLAGFIDMRKTIKKPLSERALKMIMNKLDKIAKSDDEKVLIVNQSVLHCWQDVYPYKSDTKSPGYDVANMDDLADLFS